jgi:hypothetical protein
MTMTPTFSHSKKSFSVCFSEKIADLFLTSNVEYLSERKPQKFSCGTGKIFLRNKIYFLTERVKFSYGTKFIFLRNKIHGKTGKE